jgi:hypothetical protein
LAKLLGLHGKMHTGKSAVAKLIRQKDPDSIVIMSFAGKLREVLHTLSIPEQRETMQQLGQGLRDIWPRVWVNAVETDVARHLAFGYTVIFDDLRYPNEFEYIKREGGLLVKLSADDDVRWERHKTSDKFHRQITRKIWNEKQQHVSELLLDNVDLDWNLEVNTNNLSKRDMNGIADALAISIQAMGNINGRRNLDS